MMSDNSSRDMARPGRRGKPFLMITLAAIAGGIFWTATQGEKPVAAQQAPSAIPVQTETIAPKSTKITMTGLGTVTAWKTVNITPQVSGRIVQLPFREGGNVHQGDVLVRIDPRPFQAALDQAKAKRAQDEANLVALQKNFTRDETLLTKGGYATQQTVDNERAQVQASNAAILGDQATIEAAQLNLDYASLAAPFTGVMSLRNLDVGNLVTPSTNIATLTEIEPIAVNFTLPQADLTELQTAALQGKPQTFAYDQSGKTLLAQGQLEVINNQVDQTSGTIKLKARFDNKEHRLWPGAFVQTEVVTRVEQNAMVVASAAVQRGPNGPYVWLVSPNQTVHLQPIQIDTIQGNQSVCASGLKAGDKVVVAGQYRLTEGVRVAEQSASEVKPARGGQS
jgi:multidrug efflux system membrane fusion protein